MFNAMRRVISESAISDSDDVGRTRNISSQQQQYQQQQQQQQQQEEYPQQQQEEYPQQQQQQQQLHSPDHQQRANLVEMESDDFMDVESDADRPVSHIRKASGQFSSTHSSLSGASDHNLENVDMEEDYGIIEQQHDSRGVVADPFVANHVKFVDNTNPSTEQLQEHSNKPLTSMKPSSTATTLQRMDDDDSTGSGSLRASSQNSSRDWGWFEDVHHPPEHAQQSPTAAADGKKKEQKKGKTQKYATLVPLSGTVRDVLQHQETDAAAMAVSAPTYVLEESLSSQRLWKDSAGQRPPQPVEERCFYEKMWAQNFSRSQVEYQMPVDVLTATSPISLSPFADGNFEGAATVSNDNYNFTASEDTHNKGEEAAIVSRLHETSDPHSSRHTVVNKKVKGTGSVGDLTIMVRGDNAFGTTVSKSFARPNERGGPIQGVDTVNISIASYRVVETKNNGKYAQFLVIYREGSIRDTIGVWKRYSDFEELARKVTQSHEGCVATIANMSPLAITEEPEHEQLPNAMTSWRLLKKRQRWFRCLDAGYLSLKVFLLERFLHDILFESSTPNLLREFVVTESAMMPSP